MEWDLVWCCKYCHKDEAHALRMKIGNIVEKVGGKLICLKKAARLQQRRAYPGRVSVLLTDWREAKPCMEHLLSSQVEFPQLTVVYTASEKQFKVATHWASILPLQGVHQQVRIVSATEDVRELIHIVVGLYQSSGLAGVPKVATQLGCNHTLFDCSDTLEPDAEPSPVFGTATPPEEEIDNLVKHLHLKKQALLSELRGLGQHRPVQVASSWDLEEEEAMLPPAADLSSEPAIVWPDAQGLEFEVWKWPSPIVDVLAPLLPSEDPKDVHRMLLYAMPTHYEE